jgi:hypothetical protein
MRQHQWKFGRSRAVAKGTLFLRPKQFFVPISPRLAAQFSRLLAAEVCESASSVCTMLRGLARHAGYPRHSPAASSLSLPCVAVCHGILIVLLCSLYFRIQHFLIASCVSRRIFDFIFHSDFHLLFNSDTRSKNITRALFCRTK